MLQLIIPIIAIGLAIAGCGAKTELNSPDEDNDAQTPPDASSLYSDACLPNAGERCHQFTTLIASRDQFFGHPILARTQLRREYPALPARLTDTHFSPQDTEVTTYAQVSNNMLIVGGCHPGTTGNIPFLLFYYLNPNGSIHYAHFHDPVFANIGVYIGGYPDDTSSNYHLNAALPGIDCTILNCVTSMAVLNNRLYVADNQSQAIAAYEGFNDRIHEVRGSNFCQ